MKKFVLVLLILAVVGSSAFAFNIKTFPSPIEKRSLLISPGVAIGINVNSWDLTGFQLGIPVSIEYALPINFALTVGGQTGVGLGFTSSGGGTMLSIPIMAKVAWHPNFEVKNLDLYYAIKMGLAIGIWAGAPDGWKKAGAGFAFGTDIGIRYFFTPKFGINGEVGWDGAWIKFKPKNGGGWWWSHVRHSPNTFLTVGVTFLI